MHLEGALIRGALIQIYTFFCLPVDGPTAEAEGGSHVGPTSPFLIWFSSTFDWVSVSFALRWILLYEGPVDEREEWQEKLAYIQSYLEQSKDSDSYSVTTETSDSGMAESRVAPSELGMEETSGKILLIWINFSVNLSWTIGTTNFFSFIFLSETWFLFKRLLKKQNTREASHLTIIIPTIQTLSYLFAVSFDSW